MKALVVEDNRTDLKLMHSILQMDGHEVMDAASAEEAIRLLQENTPEVILIDLRLPHMDGLALGRQLKHAPATAGIPIIAITACFEDYPKNEANAAGFSAYFVKPINTRTLARDVAAIIHSHQN